MSVILEYVWLDVNDNLRSKIKVVPNDTNPPLWNFDGSSTGQAVGFDSDIILKKSNRKDKKYNVIFVKDGKKYNIHFGAKGMSDYTKHKDRYRKYLYEMRHIRNENWQNLESAGAWSKWLLWSRPNINDAIKNIEHRFKVNIKNNI